MSKKYKVTMQTVKILITGPFNAGKTTFIKTISEISVVSTERDITDHTKSLKPETTVAMDFGKITIDEKLALYLFGTPGQERFDFMWETLSEGMLGYILMIDVSRKESIKEAKTILEFFKKLSDVPYIIALNKKDMADGSIDEEILRKKLTVEKKIPVVECNSFEKENVKDVLLCLLYLILDQTDEKEKLKKR